MPLCCYVVANVVIVIVVVVVAFVVYNGLGDGGLIQFSGIAVVVDTSCGIGIDEDDDGGDAIDSGGGFLFAFD
ncbi:hypothetical protein QVD17_16964 [Tagetes erecta]|uniref:Transmembrane protein n=1 Tax=Tagetes erecta TaxID=13708 RepID=A0AAD8KVX9_TARER|nr:hypothetical protein QVD17_16964 [Tagetes erecta]